MDPHWVAYNHNLQEESNDEEQYYANFEHVVSVFDAYIYDLPECRQKGWLK